MRVPRPLSPGESFERRMRQIVDALRGFAGFELYTDFWVPDKIVQVNLQGTHLQSGKGVHHALVFTTSKGYHYRLESLPEHVVTITGQHGALRFHNGVAQRFLPFAAHHEPLLLDRSYHVDTGSSTFDAHRIAHVGSTKDVADKAFALSSLGEFLHTCSHPSGQQWLQQVYEEFVIRGFPAWIKTVLCVYAIQFPPLVQ